jgi:hypothetical protein
LRSHSNAAAPVVATNTGIGTHSGNPCDAARSDEVGTVVRRCCAGLTAAAVGRPADGRDRGFEAAASAAAAVLVLLEVLEVEPLAGEACALFVFVALEVVGAERVLDDVGALLELVLLELVDELVDGLVDEVLEGAVVVEEGDGPEPANRTCTAGSRRSAEAWLANRASYVAESIVYAVGTQRQPGCASPAAASDSLAKIRFAACDRQAAQWQEVRPWAPRGLPHVVDRTHAVSVSAAAAGRASATAPRAARPRAPADEVRKARRPTARAAGSISLLWGFGPRRSGSGRFDGEHQWCSQHGLERPDGAFKTCQESCQPPPPRLPRPDPLRRIDPWTIGRETGHLSRYNAYGAKLRLPARPAGA